MMRAIPTCLAFWTLINVSAFAGLKDAVHGIYSLTEVADPALAQDPSWTNPNITGVIVRTWWEYVEPSQAKYDWSYIDQALALAQQYGKKIGITVVAGTRSPAWVYTAGAQKFTIQNIGVMPCPWDPVFQSYWRQFVLQFGTRYDSQAAVSYVTAGGLGRAEECYLCKTQTDVNELNADGGVQLWIRAGQTIAGFYSAAFPTTRFVYADGQPIPDDSQDFGSVVNYCVKTFGSSFGIKSDGLYSNYNMNSYGAKEIPALSPNHAVGFQDVRNFDNAVKLQGALKVGVQLKGHFIEVNTGDANASNDQSVIANAQSQLTGQ